MLYDSAESKGTEHEVRIKVNNITSIMYWLWVVNGYKCLQSTWPSAWVIPPQHPHLLQLYCTLMKSTHLKNILEQDRQVYFILHITIF